FRARFGSLPCGALVQYHVRAATTDGIAIRSPIDAPSNSWIAIAADASATVVLDDLSSGAGWIVGAEDDTATDGVWELVDPIGTGPQPEVDHTPDLVDTCFVTGQGPQFGNIGDADVDSGKTTLYSPTFDLAGVERATIAYWRWFHNSFAQIDMDEGTAPNEEPFTVWITNDNGKTWTLVEQVGPSGPETGGGWILHAFDPGSLVELTSQMRLRFVASDTGGFSIVEAGIDDLLVVTVDCVFAPRIQKQKKPAVPLVVPPQ
ncbi:MAG: hypothetical protein ACYTCU_10965, partial [Planctomycetota bacterium]